MRQNSNRLLGVGVAAVVLASGACVPTADAAIHVFTVVMDGPSESPPVASPGTGSATITFNTDLHTMRVDASFSGLLGTTTASHIHAPTAIPLAGTVGVASQTPTFSGFPLGVTSGSWDVTYDMSLTTSYSAAFLTANGGSPALAEASLLSYAQTGRAYLNIHTSAVGSGEIRGFLVPVPGSAGLLALAGAGLVRRRRR